MKILYLHGLASSKEAGTAKDLRKAFPNDTVLAIDIPAHPFEAVEAIFKTIEFFNPDIIVGSSLGGFYASLFGGPIKVLINPALQPDIEIKEILGGFGKVKYLKQRENSDKTFEFNEKDVDEYKTLKNNFHKNIKDFESLLETYALFGDHDEFVNDKAFFEKNYLPDHAYTMHSPHRLSDEAFSESLVPLINDIKVKFELD